MKRTLSALMVVASLPFAASAQATKGVPTKEKVWSIEDLKSISTKNVPELTKEFPDGGLKLKFTGEAISKMTNSNPDANEVGKYMVEMICEYSDKNTNNKTKAPAVGIKLRVHFDDKSLYERITLPTTKRSPTGVESRTKGEMLSFNGTLAIPRSHGNPRNGKGYGLGRDGSILYVINATEVKAAKE